MNKRIEMNLNDREWREFIFDDVFQIYSTSSGIDKNKLVVKKGNFPYVTRTDKNNGIDFFVCEQEIRYKKDTQNVITIGLDTQTVFYQPNEFYTGQNIQILSNEKLNYFNAQFFIPLIKKQMEKFSWGSNGATLTRLKRSKLILPSDKDNKPDYAFMEQFMRAKEQEKLEQYDNYIQKRLNELKDYKEVKSLNEQEWGEFEIGKLFKLQAGKSKGLNHLKKETNGINYLGATKNNNAVLCEVKSEKKMIQKGNCIAFIRNGEGSMGYSIYKAENFISTSDISVGYSDFLNKYIGLFITTVSDKIRGKYNFGYKRSDTRLKKEKILLPINSKNEPDYKYMENYIKKIEFEKLTQYLTRKKQ